MRVRQQVIDSAATLNLFTPDIRIAPSMTTPTCGKHAMNTLSAHCSGLGGDTEVSSQSSVIVGPGL